MSSTEKPKKLEEIKGVKAITECTGSGVDCPFVEHIMVQGRLVAFCSKLINVRCAAGGEE